MTDLIVIVNRQITHCATSARNIIDRSIVRESERERDNMSTGFTIFRTAMYYMYHLHFMRMVLKAFKFDSYSIQQH